MATLKDWLNQKFVEWEKNQGHKQSYYAFARYLEVSQSALSQWMMGSSQPDGEDLPVIAKKLGPEIYEIMGLSRPGAEKYSEAASERRLARWDSCCRLEQAMKRTDLNTPISFAGTLAQTEDAVVERYDFVEVLSFYRLEHDPTVAFEQDRRVRIDVFAHGNALNTAKSLLAFAR